MSKYKMKEEEVKEVGLELWDFEGKIEDVVARLHHAQTRAHEKGYHEVRIEIEHFYESTDVTLRGIRPETEKEREKRLAKTRKERERKRKDKEEQLEKERELYEKLKAKFE